MSDQGKIQDFVVTARKWRPLNFSSVVGQEHITQTLKNAILSERVHHAYLFSGPRGVGKTTCARILARAINCLHPVDAEPCNECENCRGVLDSRSLDVIEIDGASNNSVEDIRKLRENAKYPPSLGRYKMYIIDEVHMLSTSAFNALLKTLEEPPPHLLFIFATTEPHKVPATILSRCQRFEFRSMEIETIVAQLKYIAEKEGIAIDRDSLLTIARKADGSMRDSQSIFDQVVAFCGKSVNYSEMSDALHLVDQEFFFRVSSAIHDKDIAEIFEITNQIVTKGYDLQECLSGLIEHFRNILTVKITGDNRYIGVRNSFTDRYATEAGGFTKGDLLRALQVLAQAEQAMRMAHQPKIKFELALVQLASMDTALDAGALVAALKELKTGIKSGNFAAHQAPADLPKANQMPPLAPNLAKAAPTSSKPIAAPAKLIQAAKPIPTPEPASAPPPPPEPREYFDEAAPEAATEQSFGNSKAALAKHWHGFKAKYTPTIRELQILSDESAVRTDFADGEIKLFVGDNFVAEMILKNRVKISDALKAYFGEQVAISIEIIKNEPKALETEPAAPIEAEKGIPAAKSELPPLDIPKHQEAQPKAEKPSLEGKHETEKAIISLFDAMELKPQ